MAILVFSGFLLLLWIAVMPIVLGLAISRRIGKLERSLSRVSLLLEEQAGAEAKKAFSAEAIGEISESVCYLGETAPEGGVGGECGRRCETGEIDRTSDGGSEPPPLPSVPPELPAQMRCKTDDPPSTPNPILAWLKDDWILKLGALLLFAGLGWLVAYAAWNNWISPQVRVAGAILLGAAFLAHGWRGLDTGKKGGATFLALGTSVILASTFAGRFRHDLGSPEVALALMFATAAVVGVASVRQRIYSLGRVALVAAFVAPLLTASPDHHWAGTFAYLAVVIGGVVWLGRANGDGALPWMGLGGFGFYSLNLWLQGAGEMGGGGRPEEAGMVGADAGVMPWAYLTLAIFTAVTMAANIQAGRQGERGRIKTGAMSNIVVAGFLLLWTWWGETPQGGAIVMGCAAGLLYATGIISFHLAGYRVLLAQWGGGFILGSFALSRLGDMPELNLPLAGLGAVTTVISYLVTRAPRATLLASLSLGPGLAGSYYALASPEWSGGNWGMDAAAVAAGGLAAILASGLLYRLGGKGNDACGRVAHLLALAGAFLFLTLAWLLGQALLPGGTGSAACLTLYTIVGIAVYYAGSRSRHPCLRKYGTILLLLVATRLLTFEIWAMDTPQRIVAFISIGSLLLVTAKFARKWDAQRQVAPKGTNEGEPGRQEE